MFYGLEPKKCSFQALQGLGRSSRKFGPYPKAKAMSNRASRVAEAQRTGWRKERIRHEEVRPV